MNLKHSLFSHFHQMLPLLGITFFLLFWGVITEMNLVKSIFFPSPLSVGHVLWQKVIVSNEWIPDVLSTLLRTLASLALGGAVGLLLGLILGTSKTIHDLLESVLDFFRGIPATALFPLFVIIWGIGEISKIAAAAWVVSFLVMLNTVYGIRHANKIRLMAARMYKPGSIRYWTEIILPEAASQVTSGLRLGLNFALAVIVVTEMFIGTSHGMGYRIISAQLTYSIPEIYAGIVILGIMGYLLNQSFVWTEKRIIHWAGK